MAKRVEITENAVIEATALGFTVCKDGPMSAGLIWLNKGGGTMNDYGEVALRMLDSLRGGLNTRVDGCVKHSETAKAVRLLQGVIGVTPQWFYQADDMCVGCRRFVQRAAEEAAGLQ